MLQSTVNGLYMGDHYCANALFLRYGIDPPYIPTHCDGCNTKIPICNAPDCKKVGITTTRHYKVRDGFSDLAGKDFTPSYMHDRTLIHKGCSMREGKYQPAGYPPKNPSETTEKSYQKRDLITRDL